MQYNYRPFMDRMIHHYEGGYCWDKNDPGGPTNFGITCYDYAEYRGRKMNSMQEWAPLVRAMSLADAEAIYKTKYATPLRFDGLPSGIDVCMMDYGVNSGVVRAIRVARAILKIPGGDHIDLDLFDAFEKADARDFITKMCAERLQFMRSLKTWPTFRNGWLARVDDLRTYSLNLTTGAAHPAPPVVPAHPKAVHTDMSAAKGSTATGVIIAGVGTYAVGGPLWAGIAVAAAVAIAGALYEVWKRNRIAAANLRVTDVSGVA